MTFCRWYPLSEAESHAPARPGVFQIRVAAGLLDYPTGKSAMVHYQSAPDMRAAATAFAARHPRAPWLCRHLEEPIDAAGADTLHERLEREFSQRFGTAPRVPT
jgi:hypothetical protein